MKKIVTKKRCLLCESQMSWLQRQLERRFCSTTCADTYRTLMVNLALARLNAGPVTEESAVENRNCELKVLGRMMQVRLEEEIRMRVAQEA